MQLAIMDTLTEEQIKQLDDRMEHIRQQLNLNKKEKK
jgi:hypothetical protein